MKRCPYCGKEYPDGTKLCAIDHTPLDGNTVADEDAPLEDQPRQKFFQRFGEFGIVSEQKIPLSLSIVSYLYFLPGAAFLALSILLPMILLQSFFLDFLTNSNASLIIALAGNIFFAAVLMLLLLAFPKTLIIPASGLCLCAALYHLTPTYNKEDSWFDLVYIWLCVASVFLSRGLRGGSRRWRTCALILTWWAMLSSVGGAIWYFFSHHTHKIMDTNPVTFYAGTIIYFLFFVWQYRVLTRPDIRELFGL